MNFTFNGQSSADFGLVVKSKDRPLLPRIRQTYETVPGRDGTYDFSDNTLEDRVLEVTCSFVAASVGELRYVARNLAAWLYTTAKSQLIFDDEPDIYYMGRLENQVSLDQLVALGEFTLQFRCEPIAYYLYEAAGETLDQSTILYRERRLYEDYVFNVGSRAVVTVDNFGTAPVAPIIVITGSATTLSITCGSNTLTYGEALSSSTLTIDNDKMTATVGAANKLNKLSGSFIVLPPGIQTVTIDGTGLNLTVTFKVYVRFY